MIHQHATQVDGLNGKNKFDWINNLTVLTSTLTGKLNPRVAHVVSSLELSWKASYIKQWQILNLRGPLKDENSHALAKTDERGDMQEG